jgi:hypothetical protein
VERLLALPEGLGSVGLAARSTAMKVFSLESMVQNYALLYQKTAKR